MKRRTKLWAAFLGALAAAAAGLIVATATPGEATTTPPAPRPVPTQVTDGFGCETFPGEICKVKPRVGG